MFINDPKAEKRSLMLAQKRLCNGEQNGRPCVHYWTMLRPANVHNVDMVKKGESLRFCRAWTPEPLEFEDGTRELPFQCSQYKPDDTRVYDPTFEEYTPMTPEEAIAIGAALPAPPQAALPKPAVVSLDDVMAEEDTADEPEDEETDDDGDDPER